MIIVNALTGADIALTIPVEYTVYKVQTTSSYKKTGIYSAERDDTTQPITVNWGDGTVEQVDGDISQKVHEYATEGEFEVSVFNIKTFSASSIVITWRTTSQNAYTLKEVILGTSITGIGNNAFYGCTGLTSITIPDGVTSIGGSVFLSCTGLTSISIPDSVTSIGIQAFLGCTGLTDITIPNRVTSIRMYVFQGCSGLTSITIPSSVTSIGEQAFYNCTGLVELDCSECTQIPTLSNANALNETNANLRIIVPDALYSDWISATNWSTYASRIVKASEA